MILEIGNQQWERNNRQMVSYLEVHARLLSFILVAYLAAVNRYSEQTCCCAPSENV